VGLIVLLVTGERRGRLGDLAAGTIVADASGSKPAPESVAAEPARATVAPRATVTLPPPPAAAPVPELRPFEPELAAEVEEPEPEPEPEPVVLAEPEPVVEPEPEPEPEPVVLAEPEPVVDVAEPLVPEIASPSLRELARDLAEAGAASPQPTEDEPAEHEPAEDEPAEDEPVVIKSVETVSAIDLVMGGSAEDEDSSASPDARQG
jgi:hypothetical protein